MKRKIDHTAYKGMTKKEILVQIKKEEKRIANLKAKIDNIRFDIKATRKAIAFWKHELKKKSAKTT